MLDNNPRLQLQTAVVPSVQELIAEDRADATHLKRHTRRYLEIWLLRRRVRVRILLHYYGWKLGQIADELGVDKSTLSQLARLSDEKVAELLEACDEQAATQPSFEYPGLRRVFELAKIHDRFAVHFMSQNDEHPTPWAIVHRAARELDIPGFDLDPCATAENAKAANFFDKTQNGLAQPWAPHRFVWCNPPYTTSNLEWAKKCHEHSAKVHGGRAAMLLPARTDTLWFRDHCAFGKIIFFTGRVVFVGGVRPAPFPTMIVLFDGVQRDGQHLDAKIEAAPVNE